MLKQISLLAMIGVLILSCGPNTSKEKPLIIGIKAEPISLYPYGSNDNASARMNVQLFDRLIEQGTNGTFTPALATDWKLISPTVLEMKIRPNVQFHNGDILTVEDVKFSLETIIKSPEVEHIAGPMKEVKIVDSNTVQIILHKPFAPLLAHLTHPAASIVNKKAVLEAGINVKQVPVGTGPYKLKAWNRGQDIVLERFEEYWGPKALTKFVEFKIIPEDSTRTIALETGDIDISFEIPAADLEKVRTDNKLVLFECEVPRIEYLGFNINKNKSNIWKDQKVREAATLAIDTKGIINSVLFGAGRQAGSFITEDVFGYIYLAPYQQNIEKAKQLLAEAGVKPNTKVVIWATEGDRQKIAEIIQANLREIGFDASIAIYEWGRYLDGTAKGDHDLFILGWTNLTGDADYSIYNLFHSRSFGPAGNRSFYHNPQVDKLLDLAKEEKSIQKRSEFYKEAQEIVYREIPMVPLFYKVAIVATSKNVKGFEFSPSEAHRVDTVYFENSSN